MFITQHRKGKQKHPEMGPPPDRYDTQEDFNALVRARKIKRDLGRHEKVRSFAKEKLAERRRRGKSQGMIEHEDNSMAMFHGKHAPKGGIKEKKYPQEHVD